MSEIKNVRSSTDDEPWGPQYKKDDDFTRRMRFHQSWYRHQQLKVPYGTGTSRSSNDYYGNMLRKEAAEHGRNFLTPRIFEVAEERLSQKRNEKLRKHHDKQLDGWLDEKLADGGGAVQRDRFLRNMLSSQPMCFNLFGELALDLDLATKLVNALWGTQIAALWNLERAHAGVRVTGVCFEWAPQNHSDFLGDKHGFRCLHRV